MSALASKTLVEVCVVVLALVMSLALQSVTSRPAVIECTVTAAGAPVVGAEIVVAGKTYLTDRRGEARIEVTPGPSNSRPSGRGLPR